MALALARSIPPQRDLAHILLGATALRRRRTLTRTGIPRLHLRLRVAHVSHDPELESGSQENPSWHLRPESHPGRLLVVIITVSYRWLQALCCSSVRLQQIINIICCQLSAERRSQRTRVLPYIALRLSPKTDHAFACRSARIARPRPRPRNPSLSST